MLDYKDIITKHYGLGVNANIKVSHIGAKRS